MEKLTVTFSFLLLWNLNQFHCVDASEKCERALLPDLKMCKNRNHSIFTKLQGPASTHEVCTKQFKAALVNLEPYSTHAFFGIVDQMLSSCCGNYEKTTTVKEFDGLTQVNATSVKEADVDVVYPVVARSNAKKVHGGYFLPLLKIDGGYLMTGQLTKKMMLIRFVGSAGNLWPLLIIMLFMSVIAGFVMWLLDKGENEEEFSHSFRDGLFDGFWWGFVSMTTVGYGDKSPRSRCSRIFSVIWILIGITICSMFTASLTTELQKLNIRRSPTIQGSKIGVVKSRFLDSMAVTKEGGEAMESETGHFIDGIVDLLGKNKHDEIAGLFLDMFAYTHAHAYFSHFDTHDAKKFTERMEVTKVEFKGEPMSYGLMFKNQSDYDFLADLITDNRDAYEVCRKLGMGMDHDGGEESDGMGIFSIRAGIFLWVLGVHVLLIIAVFIYGYLYERKKKKQQTETNDGEMAGTDCETPLDE